MHRPIGNLSDVPSPVLALILGAFLLILFVVAVREGRFASPAWRIAILALILLVVIRVGMGPHFPSTFQ